MSETALNANLLQAILQATTNAIVIVDAQGKVLEANLQFFQLWNLRHEAVEEVNLNSLLESTASHLSDPEAYKTQALAAAARGNASDELELLDGRTIERSVSTEGSLAVQIWVFRDITLAKRAEELHAKLSAVVDSADDAIITKTTQGIITSWNRGAERIFGYSAEEAIGKPITMLIPPERLSEEADILAKIKRRERVHHYETERQRKDGRRIFVSITVSPLLNSAGKVIGASKIARDVSERHRPDQAKYLLAAIIDSSDDAIISKNLDSIITSWNAGAERVFGYTAEEAIGSPITMLFPPELIDEETIILSRIRSGERLKHYTTERVRKDGQRIALSITVSPIKDDAGQIIGASKIARDISEQKQHETERETLLRRERSARADAEQASRLKDEFLATVSHELRTPLNAILGWSQLLVAGKSSGTDLNEGLEVIQRNARTQAKLIEDLLDMSRIISGKVRLEVQWLNLADVIETALESVRPAAQAKSIRLRKVLNSDAGLVVGDATRLQQILWNLLSNAIKFTPKGGKVDVYLERINSHLEITVQDSGVGIQQEFLPVIFERFRQVDSSTTRNYGGLGLGLAIVKQLVELHGGTVHASSAGEGSGSTFTVHLPIAPLRRSNRQEHAGSSEMHIDRTQFDLSQIQVLLVDDEADARMLVSRLLSEYRAAVKTASGVDEALALLDEFVPHVLVSDIGMPEKDGYELIRQVRARPPERGGSIPAIALTAFARAEDRTRALLAGYQMHLTKPVEPQELGVTVYSLAQRAVTGG